MKKSSMRMEKLKEVCKLNAIEFVKPVLDVVTRWDSTLDMIRRALRIMPALKQIVNIEKEFRNYALIEEDEMFISCIIPLLTELESATVTVSFAKKPVISRTVVMFDYLEYLFEQKLESLALFYPNLSKDLLSKLKQVKNVNSYIINIFLHR